MVSSAEAEYGTIFINAQTDPKECRTHIVIDLGIWITPIV